MSTKLYLTLLACTLLPVLATAQVKPGPSQLVCVLNADETPAQLAQEPVWTNPAVKGVLVRESWSKLEPTEDNFDFSLFDQAANLAQQHGKFIGLQVGSGTLSPDWIYKAGARPFALGGSSAAKMPLPWDPVFVDAYGSMIEALGARFDRNPSVAYVMMTGTGRDYDSSLATTDDEAVRFQAMGGSLFWTHASADIAQLYTASFPHTHIIWSTAPVIPGAEGQKLVDDVASGQVDSALGQFGVTTKSLESEAYGKLSSLVTSKLADHAPLGLDLGTSNDPADVIAAATRDLVAQNATYVTAPASAINDLALSSAVQNLGNAGTLSDAVMDAATTTLATTKTVLTPTTLTMTPTVGITMTKTPTGTTVTTTTSTSSTSSTSKTSTPSTTKTITTTPTTTTTATTTGGKTTTTTPSTTTTTQTASSTTTTPTNSSSTSGTGSTETAAQETAACTQITAVMTAIGKAGTKQVWLTASPGGPVGAGTQASPLNVYTAARMTAALYNPSNGEWKNMVFHFAAGTYYTDGNPSGWVMSTGWQFLGAGQGQTIIKFDPTKVVYPSTDKIGAGRWMLGTNGLGGTLVENLTVDANCTGCGSALLSSFVMPAPRQTVTVNVASSAAYTVGKWVYVQDSVPTGGVNLYYGLMQVISISDATHVVLMNSTVPTGGTVTGTLTSGSAVITGISSMANLEEGQSLTGTGIPSGATIKYIGSGQVTLTANATATGRENIAYSAFIKSWCCPVGTVAAGTVIPATAHVLVDVQLVGISTGGANDTVENVTVQNVAEPWYEGQAGICIGSGNQTGAVVEYCTIQSVYGTNGWLMPGSFTNGLKVIGNTIKSNGYNQGISINGTGAIIENNTVLNCGYGYFSDSTTNTNYTVMGNTFEGLIPINLAGGGYTNSNFSNNQFVVTQNNGWDVQLIFAALYNNTFSKNKWTAAAGLTGVRALNYANCTGGGNVFSGNIIQSGLPIVDYNPTEGIESGNVDQNGNAVDLGLF